MTGGGGSGTKTKVTKVFILLKKVNPGLFFNTVYDESGVG